MKWNARLNRAEKTGKFTDEDITLAGSWLTCAVGERAETLDRDPIGITTAAVDKAGVEFCFHVSNNDVKKARNSYNRIQQWGARRTEKAR